MSNKNIPQTASIQSLVFGATNSSQSVTVYLHGSGEFQKGEEGQYQYPGFATLLRDNALDLEQPFVIAMCMKGERWDCVELSQYLQEVLTHFDASAVDIVGYSRGGIGVYELLQSGYPVRSATVINSRVPNSPIHTDIPLHIIHALDDQFTAINGIENYIDNCSISDVLITPWKGDHYSIEAIAKSGIWRIYPKAIESK